MNPAPQAPIGILCGMQAEALALGPLQDNPRVRVGVTGAEPERSLAEAERLADLGCAMLVSWGVAGGLDPTLRTGDLVLAGRIVTEGGDVYPITAYAAAGQRRASGAAPSPSGDSQAGPAILGLDRMVLGTAEKAVLFARTGAVAVDMESHRVARMAAMRGLPALVIRAVGDPAGRDLPGMVEGALTAEGRPRIGRVLAGLLAAPGALPALLRLRRETAAALACLRRDGRPLLASVLERMADCRG